MLVEDKYMNCKINFGECLTDILVRKNISAEKLSYVIGVSLPIVFGCTISYLIGRV